MNIISINEYNNEKIKKIQNTTKIKKTKKTDKINNNNKMVNT